MICWPSHFRGLPALACRFPFNGATLVSHYSAIGDTISRDAPYSVIQKNSRRLELSISKNTPHGRWGQGPGSVDPRFPAGLPLGSISRFGKIFPAIFPGLSRTFPPEPPNRPRKQPQPSRVFWVIGFRGTLFLRYPPPRPVFDLRWAVFMERSGGAAATVCNTAENTVRQWYCCTCLDTWNWPF